MTVVAVIPTTAGREENVHRVVDCLERQTREILYLIVEDGASGRQQPCGAHGVVVTIKEPHRPGLEQPRNVGVRCVKQLWPQATHCWFIDSDIVFAENAHELLLQGLAQEREDRILVGPYDWMGPGQTSWLPRDSSGISSDLRYPMMDVSPPSRVYHNDLSAGLACFSGNLCWPISQFEHVGGFWSELHMGRCEDGELGLRAVAMDVPISFMVDVRGCHVDHPRDLDETLRRNERDVPMLNARHPWVQGSGVFLVDRDGAAFDVQCPGCNQRIPTLLWWEHAPACGVAPEIPLVS